ncbi:conserved hypothetical protein [Shewanella sediminis HAW-EB3]|uniref:Uncharacterized protein n=1 Tax=Shewanella sediminis (strain HAW-EB3) TaxID=425104 RepID=A8G0L5_SHESH|nr:hypothetical protein [Shewanella sediminis]ABV38638.1 conserved hypothetical protein [Shewanella sediminis HAW-EB3]
MHKFSFGCSVELLTHNIAQITIEPNVEVTLEMLGEFDEYMSTIFNHDFALLIDKQNNYSYSYETLLCMGSQENLKATAVVFYDEADAKLPPQFAEMRQVDQLNIQLFSGANIGTQKALNWLEHQLCTEKKVELSY